MARPFVEILPADSIDYEKLVALLTEAFSGNRLAFSSLPSPEALKQKYTQTQGPSFLAVVVRSGRYVSATGALAVALQKSNEMFAGWQSCDTATLPQFRGGTNFLACIQAMQKTLPDDSIFFGFPNSASAPGFRLLGWNEMTTLPIWASLPRFRAHPNSVHAGAFSTSFAPKIPEELHIAKSKEYLTWRYSGITSTYLHTNGKNSVDDFSLVTRQMDFGRVKATILLEFRYGSKKDFTLGIKAFRRLALENSSQFSLVSPPRGEEVSYACHGFVKFPNLVNPRSIVLMGQGLNEHLQNVWRQGFTVGLGDWDAL